MTDLDRRVAKLRRWTWDEALHCWVDTDGVLLAGSTTYSPETNLLQAYALWDEARPEGWRLWIIQGDDNVWQVGRKLREQAYHAKFVSFTDLSRAITTAWVEAKEAACRQ